MIALIALNLFVFSGLMSGRAFAQIVDPFAVQDTTNWVPLDQYKPPEESQKTEVPQAAPSSASAPAAVQEPVLAVPDRPLDLPAMPSPSTIATPSAAFGAAATVEDAAITIEEKKDWSTFQEAEHEASRQDEAMRLMQDSSKSPFNIRFSTLPNMSVQSAPDVRVSKSRYDRQKKAAQDALKTKQTEAKGGPVAEQKPATKEQNDACQALVDYRRRQLDALESDRNTLAQIKAALSDLGLGNKLSFMTQPEGAVAPVITETPAPAPPTPQPAVKTQ